MKWQAIIFLLIFILGCAMMHSCQKELHCENCDNNLPPVANAGNDSTIILPADSTLLDGSASFDPDGTINVFEWTKISGTGSFSILNSSGRTTVVKTLEPGTYKFELKVTDNGGLSAKDTVQVVVRNAIPPNRPPVANAGVDETLTLYSDFVFLDGNLSTDPDNNITGYSWSKISGPASLNIEQPDASKTEITNIVQGVYYFELKVTDAGGLFSKDTVRKTINAPLVISPCDNIGRTQVAAQLISMGTLSQPRTGMAIVAAGNKIMFAGGMIRSGLYSSTVDIYNISSQTWSVAQLSVARGGIATVVSGNKIFFAGGTSGNDFAYNTIDIFDVSTDTWSTAQLSLEGWGIAAATVGDLVFFAGGDAGDNYVTRERRVIDIYDMVSDTWSTHLLKERKENISAVTVNNKIYFAGGAHWSDQNPPVYTSLNMIEIYDNATGTWSVSSLKEAKFNHAGIAVDNKIFWSGGLTGSTTLNVSCVVEIRDAISGISSIEYLSKRWRYPVSASVVKDDRILFFGGDERTIEIYNLQTDTWSIGTLPQSILGASVYSFDNTVYLAGMGLGAGYSSQVWKLEF